MKNTLSVNIPALPLEEISIRLNRISNILKEKGIDALLISSNSNIYYTSGRFFRGYVYLMANGKAYWYVIRPIGLDGKECVYIRKPEQIPAELEKLGAEMPKTIALELDTLTYSETERLKKVFPDSNVVSGSGILKECRTVKTNFEIELMKIDGVHQAESYRRIPKVYKEEMTDVEFQIEIERLVRLEGSLGYYRTAGNLMEINMGSVLTGDNADNPTPYDFAVGGGGIDPALPVGANGTLLRPGTTVMVDMNGAFNGYQTDMSRVWRIGEISDLAYKAHECSRKILRKLETFAVPGVALCDMYAAASKIVEDDGLQDYFMGHCQKAAFIGHGVGIELNEAPVITPRSREILAVGMTIAIEPKFVIPQVGAVGVENTYVVRENGLECITVFPEEIAEL
jgi:Xaa-Pro aminopeptidase